MNDKGLERKFNIKAYVLQVKKSVNKIGLPSFMTDIGGQNLEVEERPKKKAKRS